MLLEKFVSDILGALNKNVERDLTRDLRASAQSRGWPLDIVLRLRVETDPDSTNLVVTYPDSISGRVEDLEYGTEDLPPSPVIRNFINRMDNHRSQSIDENEYDLLSELDLA